MSTTLAPNTSLATPNSERSVYYDAESADAVNQGAKESPGADVMRKPSVATGALEPREPASDGILANKNEGHEVKPGSDIHSSSKEAATGNVRDSGYAQASNPTADAKEKDVGLVAATNPSSKLDQKDQGPVHDPSPAYAEHGNAGGAGDVKAAVPTDEKTHAEGTATGRKITKKKKSKTPSSVEPQVTPVVAASPTLPSHTTDQADVKSSTSSEDRRHALGAFANGAALTHPDAVPEEDVSQHQRSETAESQISKGAKKKITKAEVKDAKRLKKVIKAEGKAQNANLSAFLKELSKMQDVQKRASKDESNALSVSNKATARANEFYSQFLSAKAAYEQAEADAKARRDALEAARERAQETTAELAAKTREAEELRRLKMVDDREREAKLQQLSQIGKQK